MPFYFIRRSARVYGRVCALCACFATLLACKGVIHPSTQPQSGTTNSEVPAPTDGNGTGGSNEEASPVTPLPPVPEGCVAKSCEELHIACGTVDNGCGRPMVCGGCPDGQICGGDGNANTCVPAPACTTAPADASSTQATSYQEMSAVRVQSGLPCLVMDSRINLAAQRHAEYGSIHRTNPACKSSGHDEKPGCAGYVDGNFGNRLKVAGYERPSAEIAAFASGFSRALDAWLVTFWHRLPLVDPYSMDFGIGVADSFQIIDFGARRDATGSADINHSGIWIYPAEGMTVSRFGANESPEAPPPPDGCPPPSSTFATRGTFITIMFYRGQNVKVDTHELIQGDSLVKHLWLSPDWMNPDPNNTNKYPLRESNQFGMSTCPLSAGRIYTIHVKGVIQDTPFDRWSTFQTKP